MKYLDVIKEYINLAAKKIKENYILFLIIFIFIAAQGYSLILQNRIEKKKELCYSDCMPSQYQIIESECWCYNDDPNILIKLKK